ncbi:MAG: bifunctional UDP-sugar hydrolase/5'-nucleotidase [Paenisporosarcina sp.]
MIDTIHFYHTNDIHSHFKHWPRIHELVTSRKKWHLEENESSFTFDIGDFIDRSYIFTEGTLGKGNTKLLNDALYDVVTIGNNEGITLTHNDLSNLYEEANFEVIVGNLYEEDGKRPEWLKPFTILNTQMGTSIGVLAVTAEYSSFYESLGWRITPAFDALTKAIDQLRQNVDILICLSHLGIQEDEKMALQFPQIDVIFGAHTHHVLHEGKLVNKSLLAAAGKFGNFVGHVSIEYDLEEKGIVLKKAFLYDTNELAEARHEDEFLHELERIGKEKMAELVFHQNLYLNKEWFKESGLSRFFGDALMAFCQADCALFNAGLFLRDLPSGWVSSYDVHQLLPHPINPCVIELNVNELLEIYNQSLNQEWPNLELKGLGFRGTIMGKMIAHNIRIEDHKVYINNEFAQHNKTIRLATLDMFTFGYFFPSLKEAQKTYYMPDFLRDVLIWYGRSQMSN